MSHGPDHAHDDRPLPPPRVVEVADKVFAYVQPDGTWWINNTGFVVDGPVVVSVDTCATERRTRAYLDAVRARAGGVPQLVVNTHHHGDHTNGNGIVAGATIIGHRRCREEMLRNGILRPEGVFEPVEWGELTLAPPVVTFEERLDLHLGDRRLELHHVGIAAHTTNDVVVWVPEERVLFTGDLAFNGGTPFVLMGSIAGTLLALDRLVEFDAEVIVPGHGPPSGPEVLDTVGAYVRLVQEHAETAYKAGLSPLEAARQLELGSFAELTDSERLVGNMHRAFAECAGARPGADIDLAAAFADMIAFNGGRPLRCRA
ncbi:MAG TPA: MBL fold metallo-hydrolase [Acidimicrobiia bacterium]|nr:MBL fold metallo-hydrolase [Acidimicrobiia bacterium]